MGLFERFRSIVDANLEVLRRTELSPGERQDRILLLERQRRWLEAQVRHLSHRAAVLARREETGTGAPADKTRSERIDRRLHAARRALERLEEELRRLLHAHDG